MATRIVSCQAGFFCCVNECTDIEGDNDAERKFVERAHEVFTEMLKAQPFWSIPSEHHDDNFNINPYEVSEVDPEDEVVDGFVLIGIWIIAGIEIPSAHIAQMRKIFKSAIAQTSSEMGVAARYVRTKLYREVQHTSTEVLVD